MKFSKAIATLRVFLILFVATFCSGLANAQSATPQEDSTNSDATAPPQLLHALDKLVEQNRQLEKQNRELMDQIDSLRQVLAKQATPAPEEQGKKKEEKSPGVSEPSVSDEVTESQQGEGPTVASIIEA